MSRRASAVDVSAAVDVEAVDHLMRFLAVDGVSGHEGAVAAAVTDGLKQAGVPASDIRFDERVDYYPFRLAEEVPVVVRAKRAAESIGLESTTMFSHGGLDANWFARHGMPTVTIGAGQAAIHTVKEFVDLAEFANGCRLAVALATLEAQQ